MPTGTDRLIRIIRLLSFLLGAAVIIDAMFVRAGAVQWVSGLILMGIVPPEAVVAQVRRRWEK